MVDLSTLTPLPIDPVLPQIVAALRDQGLCVLQAPPGAGKTTKVPLALLAADLVQGKIVMLEPRRLAARAAAQRMATQLGEEVGQTIGYAMRGERKTSAKTRVEVVTEGLLTRRLQSDPGLEGVGAVLFDEFHERSLQADLGLALCHEVRGALRDDLALCVMSATLDAAPVAQMLGAPIITAEGRSFPVTPHWLDRPLRPGARWVDEMARLIGHAAGETTGNILAFLPGEGEIRQVAAQLSLPGVEVLPLYGALPQAEQRRVFHPGPKRRIVLATAIAETSLTLPDITVVVDGGRARRARFDPGSGMSRLITDRVTRAEATQRAGRAGRVGPGICYKLWSKGEDGGLTPFPPPEIAAADLTGLALDLAAWGAAAADLAFLTPPPQAALAEAQDLLRSLGALDGAGRLTDHGRALAKLPTHPRLAHMLVQAGLQAAPLAALLSDRDPLRGAPVDLTLRLAVLRDERAFAAETGLTPHRATLTRIRAEGARLAKGQQDPRQALSLGQMAALAFPDRIGRRRLGDAPRWILSGGKGAKMAAEDPLAGHTLLVVTDTDGNPREAQIRQAAPLSLAELREVLGNQFVTQNVARWNSQTRRVEARSQLCLGACVLEDRRWSDAPDDALAQAALDGLRDLGLDALAWGGAATRLRQRLALMHAAHPQVWPDMSDAALLDRAGDWLLPYLTPIRTAADLNRLDPHDALRNSFDWDQLQQLEAAAPSHFETPLGRHIPITYDEGGQPGIEVRLQEMFGVTTHPTVAGRPVRVTLLSPAQRPVQVTLDIPGFWDSSYPDVRKDMRGRYPKHAWPDDPRQADPTLRAKPRR